jgi:lipopolysaccharide biosynthesis glycosyltransferase
MENTNREIPIFFASDDNYVPLLAIAIKSLLTNASKEYQYSIYILTTNMSEENRDILKKMATENSTIEFIALANELDKIKHLFRLRDYYSKETYYRFFIPSLFPKYTKVLYLDCDIIVKGDISELYNIDLGDNYVAAAQEEVLLLNDTFRDYPLKTYGIPVEEYFNAGVMLMNTQRMTKDKIAEKFVALAEKYTFRIIQDEDYLNVLLKDHKKMINLGWNKTAFKNDKFDDKDLKLVHYKVIWRPWHYENVLYEDLFWEYAKQTPFYLHMRDVLDSYNEEMKAKDDSMMKNFVVTMKEDMENPNNYLKTHKVVMKETNNIFDKWGFKNTLNRISKKIKIKGYRKFYGNRKK